MFTNNWKHYKLHDVLFVKLSQNEILKRLANIYTEGLNKYIEKNGNKTELEVANISSWIQMKRLLLGIADSLNDNNLEYCIKVGNEKLNYLYYKTCVILDKKNIQIFAEMKKKGELEKVNKNKKVYLGIINIKENNELTDIDQQIDMLREAHQKKFKELFKENKFREQFEVVQEKKEINQLIYDLLIPSVIIKEEQVEVFECPNEEQLKKSQETTEIQEIKKFLIKDELNDGERKKIKINSLIWHYDFHTHEEKKKALLLEKIKILRINNVEEKLCLLYFFASLKLKENFEVDNELAKHFRFYPSDPTMKSTNSCKDNANFMASSVLGIYNIEEILYNYFDHLIKNWVNIRDLFCKMELKDKNPFDLLQHDVGLYHYKQFLNNSIDSPPSKEAINKLNLIFLLNEMNEKFAGINRKFNKMNIYLYNIFNNKLLWALNQIGFKNVNHAALLITIWTGSSCQRKIIKNNFIEEPEPKEYFSKMHFRKLQYYSSQILAILDISSYNQRERLRKHFLKAVSNVEDKNKIILNQIAIQIIVFIRWIENKIIDGVKEKIELKKRILDNNYLEEFRLHEVLEYKSIYDHLFNMNIEQILNQQKIVNEMQLKLHFYLNDYKIEEFEHDNKYKFIKWRQSIVAEELFDELNKNKNTKENKKKENFINEFSKELKNSKISRQRLYALIGPENAYKCFNLLKIIFDNSEFINLEEIRDELNDEIEAINKKENIEEQVEEEIVLNKNENNLKEVSTSVTKSKMSKKKREQLKRKTIKIEDIKLENETNKVLNENKIEESSNETNLLDFDELKFLGNETKQEDKVLSHVNDEILENSSNETTTTIDSNTSDSVNKIIKVGIEKSKVKNKKDFEKRIKKLKKKNKNKLKEINETKQLNIEKDIDLLFKKIIMSIDDAIIEVKKMVEQWKKDTFTLISGSYLINIDSIESDVDLIVIWTFNYLNNFNENLTKIMLQDFMGNISVCNFEKRNECIAEMSFYCILCRNESTTFLKKITIGVPEIKTKIYGYNFDLAFVAYPWNGNSEQFGNNIIYERNEMLKALSGYRANLKINELIFKNQENSLWAKNNFIYNGKLGFFSGSSLAILVTRLFLDYEVTDMPIYKLLSKFFNDFSQNYKTNFSNEHQNNSKPEPIILEENKNIKRYENLTNKIQDWNENNELGFRKILYFIKIEPGTEEKNIQKIMEKNKKLEKHAELVWPIITPGFPTQNVGYNINVSTRTIMWNEMKKCNLKKIFSFLALKFVKNNIKEALKTKAKNIKSIDETSEYLRNQWKKLLTNVEGFKDKYEHFLAIVCTYSNKNILYGEEFCDFVTTRIRLQLLFSIETEIEAICHANLQTPLMDKKIVLKSLEKMVGYQRAQSKAILDEFTNKIKKSYKPKNVKSNEQVNEIMFKLGFEVKYLKKEEIVKWIVLIFDNYCSRKIIGKQNLMFNVLLMYG
ncbi:PAP_central domain-containing protein [Meloidogyne graminicola]|uniref:PAP_central domain-containing protein n=1 Tax=Meloidogyne graminicola TaxID=189291 RepID=A0A8S9ZGM7_9BILA|nr:PAP_central domain-containing protein [Meloidogyne graminicola]